MDSAENTRDWHSSHIDLLQCLLDHVPEGVLDCLHATGEIKDIKDEHCIRATCRRFLIAEKLDIKAAALRLERHSRWRQNILPNGCISEVWRYGRGNFIKIKQSNNIQLLILLGEIFYLVCYLTILCRHVSCRKSNHTRFSFNLPVRMAVQS